MTRASLVISLLAVPYGPLLSINYQRGRFAPNLLDPKRLWKIGIRLRRGDSAFVFMESCARATAQAMKWKLGGPMTPAFSIAAFRSAPPSQARAFATSATS